MSKVTCGACGQTFDADITDCGCRYKSKPMTTTSEQCTEAEIAAARAIIEILRKQKKDKEPADDRTRTD